MTAPTRCGAALRGLGGLLIVSAMGSIVAGAAQDPSAVLGGVVLAADQSGEPLAHAVVSLLDPANPVRVTVIAGDDGRFEFKDLRPGRYTVRASKPAYLPMAYGARRPGEAGTAIALTAGQRLDDLRITLTRGAIIAGHVRDPGGAPAANIPVVIAPAIATSGPGDYMAASEAFTTDASGAYRAFNLPPGEYVIAAAVTNDLFGRGSIHRPTVAEIDASLFALQQGRSGAPAVPLPFPPSGPLTQQAYGWAPVFYPGTTSAADAGPVRVRAGEVHDDVDFAIDVAPHLTVAGAVFLPDGTAAPATKAISRIGPPLPVYAKSSTASQAQLAVRRSNLSGLVRASPSEFTFADVTPGLYAVAARHEDGSWAAANVRVIDRDIRDLRLVLQPPLSLSGHVRFDRPAEALLGDPPTLRVGLVPLPPDPGTVRVAGLGSGPVIGLPAPPPVTVAPDGTFSVRDILPGRLTIEVTDASGVELTGWWLASAAIDGRDLLDQPLDFGAKLGTLENVVLTLTHRRTELTGRLQTADGQAATGFHVIVFSADRTHWFPGARRTRAVRPASDGLFTVPELPAGAYLVAAVTDAIDDEWQQAAFLEQLAAFAAPVTVRAGQTVRQDLQIARPQTQGDAAR